MTEERAEPGPPVRVELPDGQMLTARLAERRPCTDGTWWYIVHLSLWPDVELQLSWSPAPCDVAMAVPAGECRPVEGQDDYRDVPTVRDRARRKRLRPARYRARPTALCQHFHHG